MKTSTLAGAMIATAVALAFTASGLNAADASPSTQPQQIKCLGANSCKGSKRVQDRDERLPRQELVRGQRLHNHG